MKFVFAITAEAVRKAWIERGEVLDPTFTVEVSDADLPQVVREKYSVEVVDFTSGEVHDGKITVVRPQKHNPDWSKSPVVAPSFPARVDAVAALQAVEQYISDCAAADRAAAEADRLRSEEIRLSRARREKQDAEYRARREAEKAAYNADRTAWIEAHGSTRLKMLLAEGLGLNETYIGERMAAERPGWVLGDSICGELDGLRDATQESLDALVAAREVAPDATLAWLADGDHVAGCAHRVEYEEFDARPILRAEFLGRTIVREIEGGGMQE